MSMKESASYNTLVLNDQGGSQMSVSEGRTSTLRAQEHGHQPIIVEKVYENHSQDTRYKDLGDVCQTVSATWGMGGNNQPLVVRERKMNEKNEPNKTVESFRIGSFGGYTDGVGTLRAGGGDAGNGGETLLLEKTYQNVVGTLDCGIAKGTQNQLVDQDMFVTNNSVVRRLTPLECERLQGFPDGWTNIGEWTDTKGKKHKSADSPRYRALGNSIALPYWAWLAERIVKQLKDDGAEDITMASMFDGIGGFPLVFQRAGAKPIWASEIEEFPIAVTKRRFPEESEHEETNNQLAVSGNDPDSEKRGQLF